MASFCGAGHPSWGAYAEMMFRTGWLSIARLFVSKRSDFLWTLIILFHVLIVRLLLSHCILCLPRGKASRYQLPISQDLGPFNLVSWVQHTFISMLCSISLALYYVRPWFIIKAKPTKTWLQTGALVTAAKSRCSHSEYSRCLSGTP